MTTFDRIYDLVALIPKGKVTTYGTLARLIGTNPKVIGYALHANTDPKNIPCHRVIKQSGEVAKGYAFGGLDGQIEILKKEGIKFDKNNKVNLEKFGYLIN